MRDEYLVVDLPIEFGSNLPSLLNKSSINLTNLHSSVWAIFKMYATDCLKEEPTVAKTFELALLELDLKISPETLYDIMAKDLPYFKTDSATMLEYAKKIIKFNKRTGKNYA